MDIKTFHQIVAAHGTNLPMLAYHRDRFGLAFTAWAAGDGATVSELKQRGYDKHLQKPFLKGITARHSYLTRDFLEGQWPAKPVFFRQKLTRWGHQHSFSWCQTSRPGTSLTLCLNLSGGMQKDIQRTAAEPINARLARHNHFRFTDGTNLAWARMDLDMATGEALIEEIQTDLLRQLVDLHKNSKRASGNSASHHSPMCFGDRRITHLHDQVLSDVRKVWDEAALFAAIDFIHNKLGIRTIYMHTPEWGWKVKGIEGNRPPESLYRELPRRFGFTRVQETPRFLLESWAALKGKERREFLRRGCLDDAEFQRIAL